MPRDPLRPRPRQFRFASFGVCHEGCFRRPATRAVICSGAKTAPAPATQDPRCWRPLNITAPCGREPVRACHAHCLRSGCPHPGPPPDPQCARQSLPASFTPHPSLRSFVQFGGVAAHPPPGERWPPPSQGAALRGRAASAAPRCATSSRRGNEARRRRRHRRRHPHQHPLSARPQADSDHAAWRAGFQPNAHTVDE